MNHVLDGYPDLPWKAAFLRGCLHIKKPIEQCVHHSYAAVDKLVLTLVAPVAAILHCGSLISACTDLLVFIDVIKCIFFTFVAASSAAVQYM